MAKAQAAVVELEQTWHWRNTMKPVSFFNLDGRVSFFILLFIMQIRLYTFILLIVIFLFFYALQRRGLSFPAALRAMRTWFIGPYRPGWSPVDKRKLLDTGSH